MDGCFYCLICTFKCVNTHHFRQLYHKNNTCCKYRFIYLQQVLFYTFDVTSVL